MGITGTYTFKQDHAQWLKQFGDPKKFPVGTRVTLQDHEGKDYVSSDFLWFKNGTKGIVIENNGGYLGIKVRFLHPVVFRWGIRPNWNFHPRDLVKSKNG